MTWDGLCFLIGKDAWRCRWIFDGDIVFRTAPLPAITSSFWQGRGSIEVDALDEALTEVRSALVSGEARDRRPSRAPTGRTLGTSPWAGDDRDVCVRTVARKVTDRRIRYRWTVSPVHCPGGTFGPGGARGPQPMIVRGGWIPERGDEVDMAMIEPEDRGVPGRREIRFPDQAPAPRYPVELAYDVTTRVGTMVHLRPIRPDDAPRLVDFHAHLSPYSVYRRFFSAHPRLSAAEVERFTCVDYVDRMALIAEDGDRLVAVGRYDRSPGKAEAEVAFVVADQYQHQGIGTLLLEQLADAGWRNGITTFVAKTLMENREMLAVFADSGFRVTTSVEDGIVSATILIEPDEAYRVALTARHARVQHPARHQADTPRC